MLRDRIGPLVAERAQLLDEGFTLNSLPFGNAPGELTDAERRQHSLRDGARSGDQQLRLLALGMKRVQRCEPLGHHSKRR